MRWWPTPTVWTHPSGIEGVDVTDYWDYGHPELLPDDARSRTYKTHRIDPDEAISIPRRNKVLTPAVKGASGKVTKPAVYVVDKPAAKDKDGKIVQAETYVREVVSFTEYDVLVRAKAVKDAAIGDVGLPVGWVGDGV